MTFVEKKEGELWIYSITDSFGDMVIRSPEKFDAEKIDMVFSTIWKHHKSDSAKNIEGSIQNTDITYHWKRTNSWIEGENKDYISI